MLYVVHLLDHVGLQVYSNTIIDAPTWWYVVSLSIWTNFRRSNLFWASTKYYSWRKTIVVAIGVIPNDWFIPHMHRPISQKNREDPLHLKKPRVTWMPDIVGVQRDTSFLKLGVYHSAWGFKSIDFVYSIVFMCCCWVPWRFDVVWKSTPVKGAVSLATLQYIALLKIFVAGWITSFHNTKMAEKQMEGTSSS
jgi:hypothetical protein